MKIKVWLLLLVSLLAGSIEARTRFVSKSGSGTNGTTWATAWTTLDSVNNTAKFGQGDTVFIGAGIWRDATKSHPYVIVANPGQSATDRTCYADSNYYNPATGKADMPWSGRRVAWLYGSDTLPASGQTWSSLGGNLWSTPYVSTVAYGFLCLFKGDTALYGQTGNPTATNQYRYTGSAVIIYSTTNPSGHYEALARECFTLGGNYSRWGVYPHDGVDNVAILGLGMMYANDRILATDEIEGNGYDRNDCSNILVSHCYLANTAGWGGVNSSALYVDQVGVIGYHSDYWRIVACSLGNVTCWTGNSGNGPPVYPLIEDRSHGNAITTYGMWYGKIDSCVFFGKFSEAGIYLKCGAMASSGSPLNNYDTLCFNLLNFDSIPDAYAMSQSNAIMAMVPFGIRIFGPSTNTAIFGNVIKWARDGILIDYSALQVPEAQQGNHHIWNNTFYNVTKPIREGWQESSSGTKTSSGNEFRYNVVYNKGVNNPAGILVAVFDINLNSEWNLIDSNLYYITGATGTSTIFDGKTFSNWNTSTATGWDKNRSYFNTSNPTFSNPAANNFSRPSSRVDTMSRTYGGFSWTKYGAVQPPPKTHYVSKTGSGSTSGATWATAWTTIAQVNANAVAGDTVIFGSGIWRGTTLIPVSGTSNNPTCYIDSLHYYNLGNYPTRRVAYIYGADSLTGWTNTGWTHGKQYLWRCSYTPGSSYPTMFYNGQAMRGQADTAAQDLLYAVDNGQNLYVHSGVDAAGTWWYNGAGLVYAWFPGNADPTVAGTDIELTNRSCINISQGSTGVMAYVSFVGLGLKYADVRTSTTDGTDPNDYNHINFVHCLLDYAGGWGGVNPSLIYNDQASATTNLCSYSNVTACSLGTVWAWTGFTGTLLRPSVDGPPVYPQVEDQSHGNDITYYTMRGGIIDSNTFFGYQSESQIYFKNARNGTDGAAVFDTVRYNYFYGQSRLPYNVRMFGANHDIVYYGNVFKGSTSGSGIHINYGTVGASAFGSGIEGRHKIYNNTFIDCGNAITQFDDEQRGFAGVSSHNEFKYNVIYKTAAGSTIQTFDSLRFWDKLDSNLYWVGSGTMNFRTPTDYSGTLGVVQTWALYTGGGAGLVTGLGSAADARSTNTTNPGLNVATFIRSSGAGEMSVTYGGNTWTKYGAIQDAAAANYLTTTPSVTVAEGGVANVSVTLNQVAATNVIFNWATSNGTGTAGVDYTSVSKTDTIFAGSLTKTLSITTLHNAGAYTNKTFTVTVSGITPSLWDNASTTKTSAITVTNIDVNKVVSIAGGTGPEGSPAQFTVTINSPSVGTTTFTYNTLDETGIAGVNYVAVASGTCTIANNSTTGTLNITTLNDGVATASKIFHVILSASSDNAYIINGGSVLNGAYTLTDATVPVGACCINGNCTQTTAANCAGMWTQGASCSPNPCSIPNPSTVFPWKISSNSRYLTKADGTPLPIIGVTNWSMIAQNTYSGASAFMTDVSSRGGNAILVNLIEHDFADHAPANIYSNSPWGASTFSTQNAAYFALADSMILKAESLGIAIFLAPVYIGQFDGTNYTQGWGNEIRSASNATMTAWGTFVGNRYKNHPNVVYVAGGDINPVNLRTKIDAFFNAVIAADTLHGRLFTGHEGRHSLTTDAWPESWINLNGSYTGMLALDSSSEIIVINDRADTATNQMPVFGLDNQYMNNLEGTTDLICHQQDYYNFFRGAVGNFYSNCPVWVGGSATSACNPASNPWSVAWTLPSALSHYYVLNLLNSYNRAWWKLRPDKTGAIITAGETVSGVKAVFAATTDSTTIMGYIPDYRTVTISELAIKTDTIHARWFNPTTGVFSEIGRYPKAASRSYLSGGENVLVLDTAGNTPNSNTFKIITRRLNVSRGKNIWR